MFDTADNTSVFDSFRQLYSATQEVEMSLEEYLELCKTDKMAYASAAERMLAAIGEPQTINTRQDPRLSRIFANRTIHVYPSFAEFHGMEEAIESVVSFFKHAAQGLEERKQVLYLLGPVGSAKSSLAERLKQLMEKFPIYAIQGSPVNESPLGLFDPVKFGKVFKDKYGIDSRYLTGISSPWAQKRLKEYGGDISRFRVVKLTPSILNQVAIAKTEPGDENNQDISTLVGKVDIRQLNRFSQDDPDAYSFSGGLCMANQGLLEFVEMFKAPIKMLHPLLTATQERNFKGTEGFGAIPFDGVILAHSNESEWQKFRNDKTNEAFLDRVCIVKVPYCLRVSEEVKIYQKLLAHSSLAGAPCAPGTLEMLAQFSVLSRLKVPDHSSLYSKMRVYDGENLKDVDPHAKPIQEYRDLAGNDEGMSGSSTRWAYKVLARVFNFDETEVAANPVHLLYVLEQQILKDNLPEEVTRHCLEFIKGYLTPKYAEFISKEIQTAYLESYSEYGQNLFERYIQFADKWIQNEEFRDPETGQIFDREALNDELTRIEKPAGIANPKDFRNEVVNFVLRARANHEGKSPAWTSYQKLREVIEASMFSKTEDLLPVISFDAKSNKDNADKHANFVERMVAKGYTEKQVRLLVEWHQRVKKSS